MKNLKNTLLLIGGCLAICSTASAIPVSITDSDDGSPTSAGDSQVATWLNGVRNDYNTDKTPTPNLPDPGSLIYKLNNDGTTAGSGTPPDPSEYPSFGAGVLHLTLPVDDYNYLVLHWGGQGGGVWQAFYLGSTTPGSEDTFTFNAPGDNGLSSYAYYDAIGSNGHTVPDAGATAGLLGLACGATAILRRKLKA